MLGNNHNLLIGYGWILTYPQQRAIILNHAMSYQGFLDTFWDMKKKNDCGDCDCA